jgi:DNA repair exonuclease SbcCD ATPase subunit
MGKNRIVYNKENSGKLLGKGGPRDIQIRQRVVQEKLLTETGPRPEIRGTEKPAQADMSQYLPFDEVRKKIEEAVEHTKKSERSRHNRELKTLNNQLEELRGKVEAFQKSTIIKDAEIEKLSTHIESTPEISDKAKEKISSRDIKIVELKSSYKTTKDRMDRAESDVKDLTQKLENAGRLLRERDEELKKVTDMLSKRDVYLREKDIELHKKTAELKTKEDELHKKEIDMAGMKSGASTSGDLEALSDKLDRLYTKIADGSIRHLVGSHMDRPALEDKIFIDPLESTDGENLDPHIKIEEEKSSEEKDRSLADDAAKLRSLLGKGSK